jgi:alpha-D-ribose 1-methylphosphonate 5-phosphate C-P lyase
VATKLADSLQQLQASYNALNNGADSTTLNQAIDQLKATSTIATKTRHASATISRHRTTATPLNSKLNSSNCKHR